MKGLKKLTALLLAMLLIFSVMSGGALAAEEEEDTLADAYLYCQEDGMPKYWLDFTGAMADDLKRAACWDRSSGYPIAGYQTGKGLDRHPDRGYRASAVKLYGTD